MAEEPPCVVLSKEKPGWPGVNGGVRFFRNSAKTLTLLREWWAWPLRQPRRQQAQYLHVFPFEQNALNDAVLTNGSFGRCVQVVPHAELYGPPGRYTRHYTGVAANKEQMLAHERGVAMLEALAAFPEWNATACAPYRRFIRLAPRMIEVEYTMHCKL